MGFLVTLSSSFPHLLPSSLTGFYLFFIIARPPQDLCICWCKVLPPELCVAYSHASYFCSRSPSPETALPTIQWKPKETCILSHLPPHDSTYHIWSFPEFLFPSLFPLPRRQLASQEISICFSSCWIPSTLKWPWLGPGTLSVLWTITRTPTLCWGL